MEIIDRDRGHRKLPIPRSAAYFASRLVQSGIDLNTVRELLGHADITMVLRYAHMLPDRLAMAVERVVRAAAPAPDSSAPQPPGSGAAGASPAPP